MKVVIKLVGSAVSMLGVPAWYEVELSNKTFGHKGAIRQIPGEKWLPLDICAKVWRCGMYNIPELALNPTAWRSLCAAHSKSSEFALQNSLSVLGM